jgi:hypothetical protein
MPATAFGLEPAYQFARLAMPCPEITGVTMSHITGLRDQSDRRRPRVPDGDRSGGHKPAAAA